VLAKSTRHNLQEITVKPGRIRDTTAHSDMSGHAIVTEGEAIVVLDGQQVRLKEKESIFIPPQAVYGILNPGKADLKLYEFLYTERERAAMPVPPLGRTMPELTRGVATAA
jgi:mannose-6-phosphate isomerase-like protein (cupin superfamily)